MLSAMPALWVTAQCVVEGHEVRAALHPAPGCLRHAAPC